MDPKRWETLKGLFEEARVLAADERACILEEMHTDDSEAGALLERMLAAAEKADSYFDDLADEVLSRPPWLHDPTVPESSKLDPLIGRSIHQYEIEECLGRGGMGVVYRARDTRLNRTVALKFLPPHLSADEAATDRFLVEARAAAALDHPNICNIHEIAEDESGRLFMAMAFYEGETLKRKIARGPLSIEEAWDCASQVASGLEAAHAHDIVHRDIKPGNVIVTPDGLVKILDFGLAKLTDVTVTGTETTVGTVAYMSPEQTKGEPVDKRTDLWSLGVVLYEMLTGERPFNGASTAVVLNAIRHEDPQPPSALRPDIPAELESLVGRLLAKEREQRPVSAEALGLGSGQTKVPRGVFAKPPAWARRRATVFGTLLVAIVATWWVATRSSGAIPPITDKSVAVLPFANLSQDPGSQLFSDGMTSEIINHLARVRDLRVISRTSVEQYRDTEKNLGEIAQELGVATIMEGDVLQVGNRFRVNAQLIRADTNGLLWADQYDGQVESLFEIQSDIAQRIAAALRATLTPAVVGEIERQPTDNLEAYGYYLRAADFDERGQMEEPYRELLPLLERAVELDPGFAEAWALLSEYHTGMYRYRWDRSAERLAQAESATRAALRLQPDAGPTHRALGFFYYWGVPDYARALEHFALAASRIPGDATVQMMMAGVLRRQGRWDEGLAAAERAVELDPAAAAALYQLATIQTWIRNYAEAERSISRAIRLNPEELWQYHAKAMLYLLWRGDTRAASAVLAELQSRVGSIEALEVSGRSARWEVMLCERRYAELLRSLNASPLDLYENLAHFAPRAQLIAQVYGLMEQPDRAAAYYDSSRVIVETELESYPDDPRLHGALGIAYAGLGRRDEAVREAELAVELQPAKQDIVYWSYRVENLARVHTMLGEYDAAVDHLDYMLSHPTRMSVPLLRIHPAWDAIRNHPPFQALLERYQ